MRKKRKHKKKNINLQNLQGMKKIIRIIQKKFKAEYLLNMLEQNRNTELDYFYEIPEYKNIFII